MATGDFELAQGDVRLKVEGLSRTIRALSKAGADAQDMKDLMHRIGNLVVRAAKVPVLTGRLSGTVRAGRGKTKAVVRAGGARTPYAGVVHYGWPARNIEPNEFLVEALNRERSDVLQALDAGLDELLRKNNLK
jgi:hypothetical protein